MAFLVEGESKGARAIKIATTLISAGLLLTLGVLLLLPSKEDPTESSAAKKARRMRTAQEEKVAAREIYRPVPVAQAAAPTDEAKLARAMDTSTARMLVQNLIEAAATENTPLKSSMLGAIERAGTSARPILEQELARAEKGSIRAALQEALVRVK
jgi:hypothetical protein